jgi:hypothetical protein
MLYGHGVRGTDGPILSFRAGSNYYNYFLSQLDWIVDMGAKNKYDEMRGHKIKVTKIIP